MQVCELLELVGREAEKHREHERGARHNASRVDQMAMLPHWEEMRGWWAGRVVEVLPLGTRLLCGHGLASAWTRTRVERLWECGPLWTV